MRLDRSIESVKRLLRASSGEGAQQQVENLQVLTGRLLAEVNASKSCVENLSQVEFKVFSQFGEDGIIQHLLRHAHIYADTFVEFGVENYQESNTRFLLVNNNWSGLIIDASPANMATVKGQSYFWRHDLQVECAFIGPDDVNDTIGRYFSGRIGLLSIDIDGMDYWVLDALNVVQPSILICEYNSLFGNERAVTVPYQDNFVRSSAHYSHLYWGASLEALRRAAARKEFSLVGCNSAGNNAFFVRNDCLKSLKAKTTCEAFVESRFRDSRGEDGQLNWLRGPSRLHEIKGCPLLDLDSGQSKSIAQLYGID